jgi:hypothetical protein
LAQLSFRGAAASAHYPFLRTFGWYEVCGADLVAHFAHHQVSAGDSDGNAATMKATLPDDLPPDTYTVGERATVKSLQFTLSDANTVTCSQEEQSVAASLGVEMPHVSALATTVALSPPALTTVTTIQKRAIAAAAKALLGALLAHFPIVLTI